MNCSVMAARSISHQRRENDCVCSPAKNTYSRLAVANRSQHLDEWKVKMNTSTTQARHFRRKAGKIAMAIAVASATVGLAMTPAYGDEHDNRGHERHRVHHYVRHDAQPFYAPAPVYYAPQPSPGISLFIPIVIR
jgi:hypothetical protein